MPERDALVPAPASCQGCGALLLPSRGGPPRKWCSERCRKTKYAGQCVDCGTATAGVGHGRANAPERCMACHAAASVIWTVDELCAALDRIERLHRRPFVTRDVNPRLIKDPGRRETALALHREHHFPWQGTLYERIGGIRACRRALDQWRARNGVEDPVEHAA